MEVPHESCSCSSYKIFAKKKPILVYLFTTDIQEASNVISDIVMSSLVGVEQAFLGAFFLVGVRAGLGTLGALG